MHAIERLFAAVADLVDNVEPGLLPDIGKARRELAERSVVEAPIAQCPPAVVELLGATPTAGDRRCASVLAALRHAAPAMRWTDPYEDRPDQMKLRAGYFVTTLIGDDSRADAALHGDTASLFLTVQGPDILYPAHSHLAPELYCAIAGTAEWQKGDEPFTARPPGSWMVHPPWMSHAMQTRSEPLVALAIWTDDLSSPATLDA